MDGKCASLVSVLPRACSTPATPVGVAAATAGELAPRERVGMRQRQQRAYGLRSRVPRFCATCVVGRVRFDARSRARRTGRCGRRAGQSRRPRPRRDHRRARAAGGTPAGSVQSNAHARRPQHARGRAAVGVAAGYFVLDRRAVAAHPSSRPRGAPVRASRVTSIAARTRVPRRGRRSRAWSPSASHADVARLERVAAASDGSRSRAAARRPRPRRAACARARAPRRCARTWCRPSAACRALRASRAISHAYGRAATRSASRAPPCLPAASAARTHARRMTSAVWSGTYTASTAASSASSAAVALDRAERRARAARPPRHRRARRRMRAAFARARARRDPTQRASGTRERAHVLLRDVGAPTVPTVSGALDLRERCAATSGGARASRHAAAEQRGDGERSLPAAKDAAFHCCQKKWLCKRGG